MKIYKNFISFEGIDFCGKSTQSNLLITALKKFGLDVQLVREPGGTPISEKIRKVILDNAHQEMHARAEILLYSAARAQLVHQTLFPLLDAGKYLIADRFFDSTTAYQGFGRGLDVEFVKALNRFATSGLLPYKTFFIDITPKEAARRGKKSGRSNDRLENEGADFFQAIYEGYKYLLAEFPGRFIVIPGEAPIDEIAVKIWDNILELWDLSFSCSSKK